MKKLFASIFLVAYTAFAGAAMVHYTGQPVSSLSSGLFAGIDTYTAKALPLTRQAAVLQVQHFHSGAYSGKIKSGANPVPVGQHYHVLCRQEWVKAPGTCTTKQPDLFAVPLFLRNLRLRI